MDQTYGDFALVYDELMDNVPYEAWWRFIRERLSACGIRDGLALDLGCGTGKMTRRMQADGYDMIGVDDSPEMLQVAREHSPAGCLYLQQDMREFELYGTVRAAICVCDSLNYLTHEEELLRVFRLVNNYLDPGGIFVFDVNTVHYYRDQLGDAVIAEDREDVSFIWENTYEEKEHLNHIGLSVFVRQRGDMFRKFEEEHIQRGYTQREIEQLLGQSGLQLLEVYDGYQDRPADGQSTRLVFLAGEHGKQGI